MGWLSFPPSARDTFLSWAVSIPCARGKNNSSGHFYRSGIFLIQSRSRYKRKCSPASWDVRSGMSFPVPRFPSLGPYPGAFKGIGNVLRVLMSALSLVLGGEWSGHANIPVCSGLDAGSSNSLV